MKKKNATGFDDCDAIEVRNALEIEKLFEKFSFIEDVDDVMDPVKLAAARAKAEEKKRLDAIEEQKIKEKIEYNRRAYGQSGKKIA